MTILKVGGLSYNGINIQHFGINSMTKEHYNKLIPYAGICELFAKCGEYVGGGDSLIPIYESMFSTTINGRCPGCLGAMLLDVNNKIKEYERNM